MLCVAADVTTSSELLKLATEVGPHICIFKTHFDAVTDFGLDTRENLVKLAREFNFLVMEDRFVYFFFNSVVVVRSFQKIFIS